MREWLWIPFSLTMLLSAARATLAASCADLGKLALSGATVTSASVVTDGALQPPYGAALSGLPLFCRVQGILHPSQDSVIHFEVWLPETGWNHRLLGTGNGGFAGSISYGQMTGNLKRGFVTMGSDAGHQAEAEDASWAYKHPEKIVDFGWRAVHLTTVQAKVIATARYGQPATRSYFDGCSDGGREALIEAQRFPEDYDGILAGAPANNWSEMLSAALALNKQVDGNPAAYIPAMKLPTITRAVLAACDAQDGLKDGILSDPRRCGFNPESLLCKAGDDLQCLTAPQVHSLEAIYAGARTPDGRLIFPGLMPGDEVGTWKDWLIGNSPAPSAYVQGFFRYMVYTDPVWNVLTANVSAAEHQALDKMGEALDAVNPDLRPFVHRGGKLILYHGWNDPAISPLNTVNYYSSIQQKVGSKESARSVALYMVAGMGHCAGGPGPSAFGQLGIPTQDGGDPFAIFSSLQHWVEDGKQPGEIIATQYGAGNTVVRTRPICTYPEEPVWDGKGDPNRASSFRCATR